MVLSILKLIYRKFAAKCQRKKIVCFADGIFIIGIPVLLRGEFKIYPVRQFAKHEP